MQKDLLLVKAINDLKNMYKDFAENKKCGYFGVSINVFKGGLTSAEKTNKETYKYK